MPTSHDPEPILLTDIIDIVSIFTRKAQDIRAGELFLKAIEADIEELVLDKLIELEQIINSEEADGIWFIELGSSLPLNDKTQALEQLARLRRYFERGDERHGVGQ